MDLKMNFKSAILEVYFTFQRQKDWRSYLTYMQKYSLILLKLKQELSKPTSTESFNEHIQYMVLLFKLIGYTRDAYHGKGEQDLAYLMIFVLYQYFPIPAMFVLNLFPQFLDKDSIENNLPYGSWKDISRFCKFVRFFSKFGDKDPLIDNAISCLNHQLDSDYHEWKSIKEKYEEDVNNPMKLTEPEKPLPKDHISLACKWSPREKKSYHWLFERCVIQWVRSVKPHYFKTVKDENHFKLAFNKGKREYRLMISELSKDWMIPQIDQCSHNWANIEPSSVSSDTLYHNRRALLNIDSQGRTRSKTTKDNDRIKCASNFEKYFIKGFESDELSSGKMFHNMDMKRFFRRVFHKSNNLSEQFLLQKTWSRLILELNSECHYLLPVLDMSLFGSNDFYSAVGIAAMISHGSSIGRRIVMYDRNPMWIDLDVFKCNLIEMTEQINQIASEKHLGSDIISALDFIVSFLVSTNTTDISKLVLVFVSDFSCVDDFNKTQIKMDDVFKKYNISEKPKFVFYNVCGNKPGKPYIENLESNGIFMINGSSFAALKYLCSVKDWDSFNSWSFFKDLMSHPRYNVLENYLHGLLSRAK